MQYTPLTPSPALLRYNHTRHLRPLRKGTTKAQSKSGSVSCLNWQIASGTWALGMGGARTTQRHELGMIKQGARGRGGGRNGESPQPVVVVSERDQSVQPFSGFTQVWGVLRGNRGRGLWMCFGMGCVQANFEKRGDDQTQTPYLHL